jgi:uncharacterized protein YxjI
MHSAFQYDYYHLRRQVLALTGKFRLYSPQGELVLYSEQKMFRLKEDIRLYSDETKSQELLYIQARQIIDFSAAYDVIDSLTGLRVGMLRRKGVRSMVRDEWQVFDAAEQQFGVLIEDSLNLALLRRLLLNLLPQNYDLISNGGRLADIRQRFNPFRYELDLDFREDTTRRLDRRLGIAAGVLLGVIEGRQD